VQTIEKRLIQTYDMILFKKKRYMTSINIFFKIRMAKAIILKFEIFERIVLSERDLMNRMNTMTQQTGIWSRFKTAVMQPSLSEQSKYNKKNLTEIRLFSF